MASMAKFEAYKKAAQQTAEAAGWVDHNNAEGRRWSGNQDILRLSPAHSSIKLVIAGQYSEGGQNYWDSPGPFNAAIMSVIVDQFDALAQAALAKLKDAETEALIAARGEVDEVVAEIAAASADPPHNATEAEAEAAIAVLEHAIEAARNSNQAGENAVVRAAAVVTTYCPPPRSQSPV